MKHIIFYIASFSLLLASCQKEPLQSGTVQGDKVSVGLYTDATAYQVPESRAGSADENGLSATPWIIVFYGTGDNALFAEAQQAIVTTGGQSYVSLTKTSSPCRLLIIGNAPATFLDSGVEKPFNKQNITAFMTAHQQFSDAADNFVTVKLAAPMQTTVPYASTVPPLPLIPVSGIYDLPSIDVNTTIGTPASKVALTRIVAKVTVENDSPDLELLSATVVTASVNGRFYQNGSTLMDNMSNTTNYLTSATGDGVSGIAPAISNTTAANPIYLYESPALQQMSVIIKAVYKGTECYYRLALYDNVLQVYNDVLRNKYYQFIITQVELPGYPTVAEAIVQPATNITYTIVVTDQTSSNVSYNGEYYVGISNDALIVYDSEAISSTVAFTVVTTTTIPFGANSITYTPLTGSPITISPAQATLAPTTGSIGTTQVLLSAPAFSGVSTGIITVQIGDIIKTVTVTRNAELPASTTSILFTGFSAAKVVSNGTGISNWLTLSPNAATAGYNDLVLPSAGDIYLILTPPTGGVTFRNGELRLASGGSGGSTKVLVKQNP